jgi:hypothetical protein
MLSDYKPNRYEQLQPNTFETGMEFRVSRLGCVKVHIYYLGRHVSRIISICIVIAL